MDNRLPAGLRGRVIFGKGNSMKFPTYEEMAQNVAEKALDEYEYKGKTLRQWVEIISAIPVTAIPATDINVATKDGTNLAEVGTDCISREQAIDALTEYGNGQTVYISVKEMVRRIEQLPPIQPKRIRGQWIIKGQAIDTVRGYWAKCSACGHSVFGGGNYCSYCGSYNKGEVME
jgi:hypothetical protein